MPQQTSYSATGRQELKFGITYMDYAMLRTRLRHVMQLDPFATANGTYHIRSCYFDNFDNKVLTQKKEGYLNRDKYRVRIYNKDASVMKLERKSKRNNTTFKSKCPITKWEFQQLCIGQFDWLQHDERELMRDLYTEMHYSCLRPVNVVDYVREAYMYPYGNVRITFDHRVQSSMRNIDIANKNLPMVDVLDRNEVILEVKYDNYLPEVIRLLLQGINVKQEAYSKYQLSRMYGL